MCALRLKNTKPNYESGIWLITTSLLFVVSCGSDSDESSSYTGSALRLPASIQFAEVNSSLQTAASRNTQSISPLAIATDPGTDYSTDSVEYFKLIEGNVAYEIMNTFLCLLNDVSAYENINNGPYKVNFSIGDCEKNRENTASNSLQYEITVDSYRIDNNSPHIIQLWFNDDSFEETNKIVGEFIVTEGLSTEHPYGLFSFRYSIYSDTNPDLNIENWQITDVANTNSKLGTNLLPRLEFAFDSDYMHVTDFPYKVHMASITQITNANLDSGQTRTYFRFEDTLQGAPNTTTSGSEDAAIFNADVVLTGNNSTTPESSTDIPPPSPFRERCYSRNTVFEEV